MFRNFKFTPNGLKATNCNPYNFKIFQNFRIESDNVYSIEPMSEMTSKYDHQYNKDTVKLLVQKKFRTDNRLAVIFNHSIKLFHVIAQEK